MCGKDGVGFMDEWSRFYGRQELYARDGVHWCTLVRGWWLSHALGLNERLRRMCGEDGVGLMDEWSRFYGRQELYARDGVHFSRIGVGA